MIRWRLLGSLMFAGAALIASGAGCSSSTPENAESTGRSQSKIIGGTPTNDHPEVSFTLAGGGVGGFIENGAILLAPTLAVTQIQAVSKDVFFPPSQQGTEVWQPAAAERSYHWSASSRSRRRSGPDVRM